MRKLRIEMECRYYLPRETRPIQRGGEYAWNWRRQHTDMTYDIPGPGEFTQWQLPPLFYTLNAAWTWRLSFTHDYRGLMFALDEPGGYRFGPYKFVESSLWSQVTFDPGGDHPNLRGPWWFRWRCPDASNDLMSKVYEYLSTIADDPAAAQLRREITLHYLGRPV